MRLHENWELFSAALQAASQPLEEGWLGETVIENVGIPVISSNDIVGL